MKKIIFVFFFILVLNSLSFSQNDSLKPKYSKADTLRGSITPERAWWDVLRYDITVKPDYNSKTIQGKTTIVFRINENDSVNRQLLGFIVNDETLPMQIDLQQPLIIDSIVKNERILSDSVHKPVYLDKNKSIKVNFSRSLNVAFLQLDPSYYGSNKTDSITIYYHGLPREAIKPPWEGGWIWKKDSLGRPWISVACQGLGSSSWYPCKDHQSDEPDSGASITIIVPDTLTAIANGRLISTKNIYDGTIAYCWAVKSPINNYNIVPYIGKYINFNEIYKGVNGNLDVNYWVLDYNLQKAKTHLQPEVQRMLKCFEFWFGAYPFYTDGYKIVEAPHLGMEHQSAVAYGNGYANGYHGIDLSASGQGMKWDFIIVHESGHEWFGNNITAKDAADEWIHEGFTNYSETLFTEYFYGKEAGNDYNFGLRKRITNKVPIIAQYGVNASGSLDIYYKASNMLHTIRHSINNDSVFRNILTGLNRQFYHQTVTTKQVEDYISIHAHFNFNKVFDQYLRTVQIPQLQYYYTKNKKKICYRWVNCIDGFNLPITFQYKGKLVQISPTPKWKTTSALSVFEEDSLQFRYYITVTKTLDLQ